MHVVVPTTARGVSSKRPRPDDYVSANNLTNLIRSLRARPEAKEFLHPVSTAVAPDYYKVIKSPMDLKTISDKLRQQRYGSFGQVGPQRTHPTARLPLSLAPAHPTAPAHGSLRCKRERAADRCVQSCVQLRTISHN